ncbi:MAG: hypothetical protein EXS03_09480 [Phycisphaerales bacterium]|nr:hypothetical protein [Phycisphaerales bacterium]
MIPAALVVCAFAALAGQLAGKPAEPTRAMWIELTPKLTASASGKHVVDPVDTPLTPRALARRAAHRTLPGLVDAGDLPIAVERVAAITATGAELRTQSRWLNAVSVTATDAEIRAIASC